MSIADKPSVDSRWYCKKLTRVPEETEDVFEKYCKIAKQDIIPHAWEIRDKAWRIYPYLTIGSFRFLEIYIIHHPCAAEVLARMREDEIFLDVGCGFAQDLRYLVLAGAPRSNVFGADIDPNFIELGCELFKDADLMSTQLFKHDFLDQEEGASEKVNYQLHGRVNIMQAANFFHLFNHEGQIHAAKTLLRFLSPEKDSLIVGRQVGNFNAREYPNPLGKGQLYMSTMYRHNAESWKALWRDIDESLDVEASLVDFSDDDSGLVVEDYLNVAQIENVDNRRLVWSVRRA